MSGRSPAQVGREPTGPAAGPRWRAVGAQAAMELRMLLRSGESLVLTLGIPLGVLVLFSQVEVLPTGGLEPLAFLVPGVLAISVVATGLVAVAIQTAFERKYGVLKRLGATPLSRPAFLLAKGLAVAVVLLAQAALVLGVAAALGWRAPGSVALAAAGVLLGALTFTALGMLMAGALRAEATLALSNALFLVLIAVSGVAFDAAALPEPLAALGRVLPAGALGELLREALLAGRVAAGEAAVLLAWAAGATLAAARTFRWAP